MLSIILLGTADACGTPVHGCRCARCQEALREPWLRRRQTCILVQRDQTNVLIDMGTGEHIHSLQAVDLDAAFITHMHIDHIGGFFALRWTQRTGGLPVYYPEAAGEEPEGAMLLGEPIGLKLQPLAPFSAVAVAGLQVTPVPLQHGRVAHGYVVEEVESGATAAVLLDTSGLPETTLAWFADHPPDIAIIDSCYPPGEFTEGHNGVDEALTFINQIGAGQGVLSHIAHHNWGYRDLVAYVGAWDGGRSLVAYDGLRLNL